MKNRIILYFPKTGENPRLMEMPYPLLAIAGPLLDAGFKVDIIDGRVDDFRRRLNACDDMLFVGVSSLTGSQIKDGLAFSKAVKAVRPEIPVVWGGWHVSILPEQSLENPYIDIVVMGQGEQTVLEVADAINGNKPLYDVSGIGYKDNGCIMSNGRRPIESLDHFPSPLRAFNLIDIDRYPGRPSVKGARFFTYLTSQGCPFRCAFCADPLVYRRRLVYKSPGKVLADLEILKEKYGATEVLFLDDNFLVNLNRVEEICSGMISMRLNLKWSTTARTGVISRIPDALLQKIKNSGCDLLHPGVEGSTQEILDMMNKDERAENTFICAEKLAKYNIRGLYSFIVGFPFEPDYAVEKTFEVIRRLKEIDKNNIMPVNFYTPYPGNGLFESAIEAGFKAPQRLEDWAEFDTRFGNIPWITNTFRDHVMKKDKYYYPAAVPSDTLIAKMNRGYMKYVYRVFHKIAKYRVYSGNFDFTVDWRILLAYWKFWQKYRTKIPLPDIHFRW